MPGSIHHIEWCVSDLQSQVRSLVTQYGFKPIGQRIRKLGSDWIVRQVLVKSGDTVFMLTQKSRTSLKDQQNGEWNLFNYNARQVTVSWFSRMTWVAEKSTNTLLVALCSITHVFKHQLTATRLELLLFHQHILWFLTIRSLHRKRKQTADVRKFSCLLLFSMEASSD